MEALTLIVSVISAISAAVVAYVAWEALRRFRSQKWWERRVDSYLEVLGALSDASAYFDRELLADMRQSPVPAQQTEDLAEKARKADREIRRTVDLAELFISTKAYRRLKQYMQDSARAVRTIDDEGNQVSWTDHLSAGLDAVTTCQADMIKIAKEDLELPSVDKAKPAPKD